MKSIRRLFGLLAAILMFTTSLAVAPASAVPTTISGSVIDDNGVGLESILVEVMVVDTTTALASDTTDATGAFDVTVEPGTYDIRLTTPEAREVLISDQTLAEGDTVNLVLYPEGAEVSVVVDVGQHINGTIYQTANTRKYLYAYNADTNQLVSQQTGYIDTPIELALFANSNIYLYGYTYWSENGSSANFTFRDDPTAIAGPTTIDVSAPSALTNFKVTDTNGQQLTGFTG